MKKETLRLYAITNSFDFEKDDMASYLKDIDIALSNGVTILQMRQKSGSDEQKEMLAQDILAICKKHGIPLIINDDVLLAKKIKAAGVHVGQSDMELERTRKLLGEDFIIGQTAKTIEQMKIANENGADYIGSGAVFSTSTKLDAKPIDWELFENICKQSKIPVVAIGGITGENVKKLAGLSMAGVAVVGGIFNQSDIKMATLDLRKKADSICES